MAKARFFQDTNGATLAGLMTSAEVILISSGSATRGSVRVTWRPGLGEIHVDRIPPRTNSSEFERAVFRDKDVGQVSEAYNELIKELE